MHKRVCGICNERGLCLDLSCAALLLIYWFFCCLVLAYVIYVNFVCNCRCASCLIMVTVVADEYLRYVPSDLPSGALSCETR